MSKSGKVGSTKTQATKVTVKAPNVPKITSKAPSAPKITRIPASSSIKVRVAPTPKMVRPVASAVISRPASKVPGIAPMKGRSGTGTVSHSRIASHLGQKKTLATANQVSRILIGRHLKRINLKQVCTGGKVFEQKVNTHLLRQKKMLANQCGVERSNGRDGFIDHVVLQGSNRLLAWEDKNSHLNQIKLDTLKKYVRQAQSYQGAKIKSGVFEGRQTRSDKSILAFAKPQLITSEAKTKLTNLKRYAKDRNVSIKLIS